MSEFYFAARSNEGGRVAIKCKYIGIHITGKEERWIVTSCRAETEQQAYDKMIRGDTHMMIIPAFMAASFAADILQECDK